MKSRAAHHRLPLMLLLTLLCIAGVVMSGCDRWQPPEVVEVRGAEAWMCMSPFYGLMFAAAEEGKPACLLLRHNELIIPDSDEDYGVPYRLSDGYSLNISGDEGLVMLNGEVVSISLLEEESWQWLEKATPDETASLRFIIIEEVPAPGRWNLLTDLASENPDIDFNVGSEEILSRILPLFDPEILLTGEIELNRELQNLLTDERRLHTLAIEDSEGMDFSFLAGIAKLHTLFITDWFPGTGDKLPDGLKGLRSLTIVDGGMDDLSCLGLQPRLEELNLVQLDLIDLSALANHTQMRTLCLRTSDELTDLSVLKKLNRLEWLALPPGVTQQQLEEIIDTHPDLALLEIVDCEQITDLEPVSRLADLQVLIQTSDAPLDPLYQMKDLKLLTIGVEEDEQLLARLQAELPETAIVRVAPICLGSGLILLLLPAALGIWWLARLRNRRRGPACLHG